MSQALQYFPPGTLLVGKYRIQRQLGEGGMGRVYLAQHIHLEHPVAVKVLLPQYAEDPGIRERFLREARAAAKLKSPHASEVLDVGEATDALPFFVMEYLEGHDLQQHISETGASPVPFVIDLLLQALDALAEAHSMQLVHRDLKPENLFLTQRPGGSPLLKVLDFGISKDLTRLAASALTAPSTVLGSPQYMAPEQMQAHEVDHRADIWALGVILYELLCGQRAFDGETLPEVCSQVLGGPPVALRSLAPELPEPLYAVVETCLSFDAEGRYADVGELASALGPFLPKGAEDRVQRIRAILRGNGSSQRAFGTDQTGTTPPSPSAPTISIEGPPRGTTEASMALGPTELQLPTTPGRRVGLLAAGVLVLGVLGFWWSRSLHGGDTPPEPAVAADEAKGSDPLASGSPPVQFEPGPTARSPRSSQSGPTHKTAASSQQQVSPSPTPETSARTTSRPQPIKPPAAPPGAPRATKRRDSEVTPSSPSPATPSLDDAWNIDNFGGRH